MAEDDMEMDDQLDDQQEEDQEIESQDSDSGDSDSSDSGNNDEELVAAAAVAHSSLVARNKVRESMASEIEAFLAKGGTIKQVDDDVMGDPPRKPQTSYGSRPI